MAEPSSSYLTCHIILNIIKKKLKYKVEEKLDNDHFGFKKGKDAKSYLSFETITKKKI